MMRVHALSGRVAVVTGASRGLGREIARALWAQGASVMMIARDESSLQETARQLTEPVEPKQRTATYVANLADTDTVARAAAHCTDKLGPPDILVNNAATQGPIGPFENVPFDEWRRVFEVDFLAAARLAQLVIPGMRARGWGKIVNISGGGATGPRPDFSAYACAKTALVRLTETLAEELKGSGIDVNAVAPGAMNTRMLDETIAAGPQGASREYDAAVQRREKGGVPPERAAELVAFLAGPVSDGITGRLISAVWDDWRRLPERADALAGSDVYTLRRIVPKDRGLDW